MRHWTRQIAVMVCVCAGIAISCAKKEKPASETTGSTGAEATPANEPLTPATAPYAPVITAKGYEVIQARRFPAQVDSRRATVVVYRAKDGARGGVLYVRGFQEDAPRPVWHWYFNDAAPDSVAAADVNRDGLWDVRVYMAGGTTREFLQDKDFSFTGAERSGLVAMNGASSSTDGEFMVFDADTSTAWKAPSSGAYIDIPNPFGLEAGQLTVRLAGGSRPSKLEIGDGTRKIQDVDLSSTSDEQRFQLDAAVKTLPVIRVGVVGPAKSVAISELELQ